MWNCLRSKVFAPRTQKFSNDITNVLPTELLSKIFIHAIPLPAGKGGIRDGYKLAVALAAVCSRWRSIAIVTPELWSSILISYHHSMTRLNILELWINRSRLLDLNIQINYPYSLNHEYSKRLSEILLPILHRTRSLDVARSSWDMSRILNSQMEWPHLTTVMFFGEWTLLDMLKLLRKAINLVNGGFSVRAAMENYAEIGQITCPHLQNLRLSIISARQSFLDMLNLPRLEVFNWSGTSFSGIWSWSIFRMFLMRSRCSLRELSVNGHFRGLPFTTGANARSMIEALQLSPMLQMLRLRDEVAFTMLNSPYALSQMVFNSPDHAEILPSLCILDLGTSVAEYAPSARDLSSLVNMLSSRWTSRAEWTSETKRHLSKVYLGFSEPVINIGHNYSISILRQMKQEGLDLTMEKLGSQGAPNFDLLGT